MYIVKHIVKHYYINHLSLNNNYNFHHNIFNYYYKYMNLLNIYLYITYFIQN